MSDCSKHKKEVAGIKSMAFLADEIANLHYHSLHELLYHLSKKISADSERDHEAGREKLADALQYASMSIFESALRMEKVWEVCKPFMNPSTPHQ
jgi:hypothetical protein